MMRGARRKDFPLGDQCACPDQRFRANVRLIQNDGLDAYQ